MVPSTYELIDAGNFKKLEKIGPFKFIRPAPQATWKPSCRQEWKQYDAEFQRGQNGDGKWIFKNKQLPSKFEMTFSHNLKLFVKLTDFGHLGFFPEHHNISDLMELLSSTSSKPLRILNLFAYTGALSILTAKLGAEVTHVDSSKTSVQWAKDNATLNHDKPLKIRWIVEDVKKFVAREIRRKSLYDIIILDPPSFGRGTKGEVWKIEEDLIPLLEQIKELQSSNFCFLKLSSHSAGHTPIALYNLLQDICCKSKGTFVYKEMTVQSQQGMLLPSGASCTYRVEDRGHVDKR